MDRYIISKKQAIEDGVNLDNVVYCRQIRRLAALDRITLDESIHSVNEYSKHLFSYIEYCGLNPKDYIKNYLSNLQPYMLEHLGSQEKTNTMICVLDNAYRISLYIKADRAKGNEVIISFHENSKRGIAKDNNQIIRNNINETVPVFGEPTGTKLEGSDKEQIKVFIQRGMLVFPVLVMAQACEDGIYLVRRNDIEQPIIDACNQYLRDLYASNIDLKALDQVEVFSVLQQISFTSYGNTIFSNITLLIDNMEMQRGIPSKLAADFALTTYINHLYLTNEQVKELTDLLTEKYKVSASRNMPSLLNRIYDELFAIADNELPIVDATMNEQDTPSIEDSHVEEDIPYTNISKRKPGR